MFESTNLPELAKLAQGIIATQGTSRSKPWNLTDDVHRRIHAAMFGRGVPDRHIADASAQEQKGLLNLFTQNVAGPIIELLPSDIAAFAVLLLYEEFVNGVFIDPMMEADIGGGD
jgi:hypothetical protein